MNDLKSFADSLEASLWRDLIDCWYPRAVDPAGGFHQSFDRRWQPGPDESRFIVFQSRLTWTASTLAEAAPHRREEFLGYADHGVRFLCERMFEDGAFQWWIGEHENRFGEKPGRRITYGNSFAIFALAAAARIGVDRALDHARRTFEWLEEHCRDTEYGGYFELTERDGTPVLDPMDAAATRRDGLASSHGIKTQNTSLHLLEAFTELYRVWPDARVRERIRELMELLTGPFLLDGIHSAQMLYRDLKPATEQISYGHDIEAAHLLLAAARTLGDPLPTGVARGFADYVLVEGRDPVHGGISYFGTPGNSPTQRRKHWWVMPEAILGYLAVYRETMHEGYLRAADELWRWTQEHLVDKEFGGWFGELDEENRVVDDRKGHAWKANYHETRALLFGARVLRSID